MLGGVELDAGSFLLSCGVGLKKMNGLIALYSSTFFLLLVLLLFCSYFCSCFLLMFLTAPPTSTPFFYSYSYFLLLFPASKCTTFLRLLLLLFLLLFLLLLIALLCTPIRDFLFLFSQPFSFCCSEFSMVLSLVLPCSSYSSYSSLFFLSFLSFPNHLFFPTLPYSSLFFLFVDKLSLDALRISFIVFDAEGSWLDDRVAPSPGPN
jgi:hypothetical protein